MVLPTITTNTPSTTTVTTTTASSATAPLASPSYGDGPNIGQNEHCAITIKLPQFWPQSPEVWFVTAEAQFNLHRITSESRKYTHLLTALPPDIIQNNLDLIQDPYDSNNLYTNFKNELLKRLLPNEEHRIMELLYNTEMGDRKPSVFYRYLLQLVGTSTEIGNKVIRKIFLDRLPKPIQRTLITIEKFPITEQLSIADKLWEADTVHHHSINKISMDNRLVKDIDFKHSAYPTPCDFSSFKDEFKELKNILGKILESKINVGNTPNESFKPNNKHFSNNFKRSKSKDKTSPQQDDVCWCHKKYGDQASKCMKPCKYFPKLKNPDDSKN